MTRAHGPLSGTVVIDLTRVLAGPYCTMVLADLGARVIKVEAPGRGDDARQIGPFVKGRSAYFLSLNRGKESIALDLKADADRAIFESLLDRADVLVENFRPGAMGRLGYGWDALHERWPALVMASTSGFGQTGPYAPLPAYDVVVQGMGGIMSLTGHPGGPPARVGTSLGDIAAGLFTAIGIQAALLERVRSGEGMQVDVAMLDCQVAMLENAIARYMATGEVPGPLGTRHPSITPFQALRTADGFVIVAAGNDALFAKLARELSLAELSEDARFSTNDLRNQNVDALADALEGALRTAPTAKWIERLRAAGVPCGPLNDVAAVLADPQVAARNMVVSLTDPQAGRLELAGNPIKLSGVSDPDTRPPAPELDADRARILDELAGGPADELEPSYRDVVAARRHVARHLGRTPLFHHPGLDGLLGAEVWVKHENHHALGVFKVRGGVNLAAGLSAEERAAGLFTASTGNHGQSIAYAGQVSGTPVTVAVPEGSNSAKIASMRALGAEVVVHGRDFDEAREWIARRAEQQGGRFLGPTEPELIAGVGTYVLEVFEDLPEAEVIVAPVGAGSCAASACLVGKTLNPQLQVFAVQAERAPAAYLAWKKGSPVPADMGTRAEGLATRVSFANTQKILRHPQIGLDGFVLVSDDELDEAILTLVEHTHNLAEAAGAAALAGALRIRERLAGKRVVLVMSGGNLSRDGLERITARRAGGAGYTAP